MHRRQVAQFLLASGAASALTSQPAQAQTTCGTGPCYPITGAETANGITPSNYGYPPGNVKRYGATGNGTTDDGPAIQRAIDSGAEVVYFPQNYQGVPVEAIYRVGAPLRIRPATTFNVTFVGEGRTNTYIAPLTANIADGLGVNALIVNQADNGKFSMSNLRFWSGGNGYTGIVLYAVEGGAAGTGQAIFSGSIDNCWFDLGETATGVFRGALNNYRVSNCTFEFMKGCFYRQGIGMADVYFVNNVVSSCFDAFYDGTTDTDGDNMVTIDGLHVYGHKRGQIVQTQNSNNWTVSNVVLLAATAAEGLIGDVGLFKFANSRAILCSNFNASRLSIFGGSGPLGEVISIAGSSLKLSQGIVDGADFGIRLTGSATVDLTVDNVDIVNSNLAAFAVQSGSPPGRVRVDNCNWSDANGTLVAFTSAAAFDMVVTNCRFLNAGLTTAAARNIGIATSGTAVFESCTVGRNTGSAAASYYIDAAGSGVLTFRRPQFVGAPPGGTKIGSQVAYLVSDPAPTVL
jgi:hypothetical protein